MPYSNPNSPSTLEARPGGSSSSLNQPASPFTFSTRAIERAQQHRPPVGAMQSSHRSHSHDHHQTPLTSPPSSSSASAEPWSSPQPGPMPTLPRRSRSSSNSHFGGLTSPSGPQGMSLPRRASKERNPGGLGLIGAEMAARPLSPPPASAISSTTDTSNEEPQQPQPSLETAAASVASSSSSSSSSPSSSSSSSPAPSSTSTPPPPSATTLSSSSPPLPLLPTPRRNASLTHPTHGALKRAGSPSLRVDIPPPPMGASSTATPLHLHHQPPASATLPILNRSGDDSYHHSSYASHSRHESLLGFPPVDRPGGPMVRKKSGELVRPALKSASSIGGRRYSYSSPASAGIEGTVESDADDDVLDGAAASLSDGRGRRPGKHSSSASTGGGGGGSDDDHDGSGSAGPGSGGWERCRSEPATPGTERKSLRFAGDDGDENEHLEQIVLFKREHKVTVVGRVLEGEDLDRIGTTDTETEGEGGGGFGGFGPAGNRRAPPGSIWASPRYNATTPTTRSGLGLGLVAGGSAGTATTERERIELSETESTPVPRIEGLNLTSPAAAGSRGRPLLVPKWDMVVLEALNLEDAGTGGALTLKGTIVVKNVSFGKWVAIRFTFDDWQTVSEVSAVHHSHIPTVSLADQDPDGRGWDRFAFSIRLDDVRRKIEERHLQLAVRYSVDGGEEWWDSCEGKNYRIRFKKEKIPVPQPTQPKPAAASTSSQHHHHHHHHHQHSGRPLLSAQDFISLLEPPRTQSPSLRPDLSASSSSSSSGIDTHASFEATRRPPISSSASSSSAATNPIAPQQPRPSPTRWTFPLVLAPAPPHSASSPSPEPPTPKAASPFHMGALSSSPPPIGRGGNGHTRSRSSDLLTGSGSSLASLSDNKNGSSGSSANDEGVGGKRLIEPSPSPPLIIRASSSSPSSSSTATAKATLFPSATRISPPPPKTSVPVAVSAPGLPSPPSSASHSPPSPSASPLPETPTPLSAELDDVNAGPKVVPFDAISPTDSPTGGFAAQQTGEQQQLHNHVGVGVRGGLRETKRRGNERLSPILSPAANALTPAASAAPASATNGGSGSSAGLSSSSYADFIDKYCFFRGETSIVPPPSPATSLSISSAHHSPVGSGLSSPPHSTTGSPLMGRSGLSTPVGSVSSGGRSGPGTPRLGEGQGSGVFWDPASSGGKVVATR